MSHSSSSQVLPGALSPPLSCQRVSTFSGLRVLEHSGYLDSCCHSPTWRSLTPRLIEPHLHLSPWLFLQAWLTCVLFLKPLPIPSVCPGPAFQPGLSLPAAQVLGWSGFFRDSTVPGCCLASYTLRALHLAKAYSPFKTQLKCPLLL